MPIVKPLEKDNGMRTLLHIFAFLGIALLTATTVRAADENFVLGPGDVIEVNVWEEPTLSRDALIRPDGKFSFPLIGEVDAANRTVADIQKEMNKRIAAFIPEAPATVILKTMNSRSISIVGQVKAPGRFPLFAPVRVMEAMAMAGGLTPYADEDILILRDSNGQQTTLEFDYGKVASGKDVSQNILLHPGDTIVVN